MPPNGKTQDSVLGHNNGLGSVKNQSGGLTLSLELEDLLKKL